MSRFRRNGTCSSAANRHIGRSFVSNDRAVTTARSLCVLTRLGEAMDKRFRRASIVAAATAAVMACSPAQALSFNDISGKWCSAGGSEELTRNTLIAIRSSDRARFDFKIEHYEFGETTVTVYWVDTKKQSVNTDFGEFSADGRHMVQFKNEAGPRREFRRC